MNRLRFADTISFEAEELGFGDGARDGGRSGKAFAALAPAPAVKSSS
jgi:hypothetical protein